MWVMFAFFVVVIVIFIMVALFFPEWVGITGSKAHEIQAHQQEEKTSEKKGNSEQEK